MEAGIRENQGKPRWSLVDFSSLEGMVRVLEYGAKKYSDDNWKKGLKTTEVAESLLRHTFAFLSGQDNDEETGLSHVAHIQCNAMFLAYMMNNKPEFDTRQDTHTQYPLSDVHKAEINGNRIQSPPVEKTDGQKKL